jgi:hypothetical protein
LGSLFLAATGGALAIGTTLAIVTAGASGGVSLFDDAAAGTSSIGVDRFLNGRLGGHG